MSVLARIPQVPQLPLPQWGPFSRQGTDRVDEEQQTASEGAEPSEEEKRREEERRQIEKQRRLEEEQEAAIRLVQSQVWTA